MPHAPPAIRRKCLLVAAYTLTALVPIGPASPFAAELRISWASGTEYDLQGYRLRYRTEFGPWTEAMDQGEATSTTLDGLDPETTYFFAVVAYDRAGNESAPSVELAGRIPSSLAPIPEPLAALDAATNSIYAARSQRQSIRFLGRNLQPGAVVSLGPDILVDPAVAGQTGDLVATILVDESAALGPRAATIANPDRGIGSASDLLRIVKSPDSNRDCAVDILDLNALARAWNEASGEGRYVSEVDLDGDDYVGPEDLTIFVKFLGRVPWGCP